MNSKDLSKDRAHEIVRAIQAKQGWEGKAIIIEKTLLPPLQSNKVATEFIEEIHRALHGIDRPVVTLALNIGEFLAAANAGKSDAIVALCKIMPSAQEALFKAKRKPGCKAIFYLICGFEAGKGFRYANETVEIDKLAKRSIQAAQLVAPVSATT